MFYLRRFSITVYVCLSNILRVVGQFNHYPLTHFLTHFAVLFFLPDFLRPGFPERKGVVSLGHGFTLVH